MKIKYNKDTKSFSIYPSGQLVDDIHLYSVADIEKRIKLRKNNKSLSLLALLLKDYKVAKTNKSIDKNDLYQSFLFDIDVIFIALKNPEPSQFRSVINKYAPMASSQADDYLKKGIKNNDPKVATKVYQILKVALWLAI